MVQWFEDLDERDDVTGFLALPPPPQPSAQGDGDHGDPHAEDLATAEGMPERE